jgi:hypothetical protein
MPTPEDLPELDPPTLREALAQAGLNERLRNSVFDALRQAQKETDDAASLQSEVRWPIVRALLQRAQTQT